MRLVLARHGETVYNREGRMQGRSDHGLTEEGWRQANALAVALRGLQTDAVYTSPLRRAKETAGVIARAIDLQTAEIDGLLELDAGELDGLTIPEVEQRFPGFIRSWRLDPAAALAPGGESLSALQQRAWTAVEDLAARHPQATLIAVSHHFTIMVILCRALELPLGFFRKIRHRVAAVTTLELDPRGGWVLHGVNDTCHLRPLEPSTDRGDTR